MLKFRLSYFFKVDWIRRGLEKLGFNIQLQRPFNISAWFPFIFRVLNLWRGFTRVMDALERKGFPFSEWLAEYWVIVASMK
jgi:hypothetical protein